MPWAKLDDHFHDHAKVITAGHEAIGLFALTLTWACGQQTDGKVPAHVPQRFAGGRSKALCRRLVEAGLFEVHEDGWIIHDFLDYNPSRTRSQAVSEERSEAGKKGAEARWGAGKKDAVAKPEDGKADGNLLANGQQKYAPARPVPSRPEERPAAPPAPPRLDVEQVCSAVVAAEVAKNSKRPTVTDAWRREARLLLDRDGRPLAEVLAVIEWTRDHKFWRSNIRSVPKLREQFDTLRLQREDSRPSTPAYRGHSALDTSSPTYDPHLEHLANW